MTYSEHELEFTFAKNHMPDANLMPALFRTAAVMAIGSFTLRE